MLRMEQQYNPELNTFMKNQRQSLKQFEKIHEYSDEDNISDGSDGENTTFARQISFHPSTNEPAGDGGGGADALANNIAAIIGKGRGNTEYTKKSKKEEVTMEQPPQAGTFTGLQK